MGFDKNWTQEPFKHLSEVNTFCPDSNPLDKVIKTGMKAIGNLSDKCKLASVPFFLMPICYVLMLGVEYPS